MQVGWLLVLSVVPSAELELEWTAPAACPNQKTVAEAIEALIGRSIGMGPDAARAVSVRIEPIETGYRAELLWVRPRRAEPRRLEAPSCAEVAEAVAVIVALALDAAPMDAPVETATRAQGPPRTLDRNAARRVLRPRRMPPAEPRAPAPPWFWGAGEVSSNPVFVREGWGWGLHAGGQGDGWRVSVGGIHRFSRFVTASFGSGGRFEMWAGVVRGCLDIGAVSKLAFDACLATEVGVVRGQGRGIAQSRSALGGWWVVSAELQARYPLGAGWFTYLRGAETVPVTRPVFRIDGLDVVYQPPRVAWGTSLGLGILLF